MTYAVIDTKKFDDLRLHAYKYSSACLYSVVFSEEVCLSYDLEQPSNRDVKLKRVPEVTCTA